MTEKKAKTFINLISDEKVTSHDAVLHRLNTQYRYGDMYLMMNSDAFEKSIGEWLNAKLIFGIGHPDMDTAYFAPGLAAAVDGSVEVGKITNAWINPADNKLMANFEFSGDYTAEIENLIKEGKLSLSSGFHSIDSIDEETGMVRFEEVVPNHVLLFVENEWNRPRDPASGIVNILGGTNMATLEEMAKTNAESKVKIDEMTAKVSTLEAEKAKINSELTAKTNDLAAAEEKIRSLEADNEKFKTDALEIEWNGIVSTLPAAIAKDATKLEEAKKEFMADPLAFYRKQAVAAKTSLQEMAAKTSKAGSTDNSAGTEEGTVSYKGKTYTESEFLKIIGG